MKNLFPYIRNSMSKLSEVVVNGISLIMKGNVPAVVHAGTKFAILKAKTPENMAKLEALEKKFLTLSGE